MAVGILLLGEGVRKTQHGTNEVSSGVGMEYLAAGVELTYACFGVVGRSTAWIF